MGDRMNTDRVSVFIRSDPQTEEKIGFSSVRKIGALRRRVITGVSGYSSADTRNHIGTNVCPFFIRKRMDEKADIRSAHVKGA